MNWTAAEAFCVSKGGHLASAASPAHWQKLQHFIAENDLSNDMIWLGATDWGKQGDWAWTDGSKWSEEHWGSSEPDNIPGRQNCLYVWNGKWSDYTCNHDYYFICSLPSKVRITSDSRLVFTADNISMPALQFTWVTQPSSSQGNNEEQRLKTDPEEGKSMSPTNIGYIPNFANGFLF